MRYFPESALVQLEFDKVKALLVGHCQSEYAKEKSSGLRIHTQQSFIRESLQQTHEFKSLLQQGQHFPNDDILNLSRELRLLSIDGAVLKADHFMQIRRLAENMSRMIRWFDAARRMAYPAMARIIEGTHYEKRIVGWIDEIFLESGSVRDQASGALAEIRQNLERKRNELRRLFDRIVSKLNKAGFVADIEEGFLNGRRVVAIFAEHKRQVRGILHGESDTRKTAFIEPEETIGLNNDIFSLEHEESGEIYRILRDLTARLAPFAGLLQQYHNISGEFDFLLAKAKLALDMNGNMPLLSDEAMVHFLQAYHPLLYLYNKKNQKPTVPTQVDLDEKNRILVISGPNAGGKTVTLKTVGLLQLMVQSGLLIPVHPDSRVGIFRQIMIHIGDTQSLEFELSTYSSQLKNLKHIIEQANGRTLFFIDELGSGSDPNLGGAFGEVILEELVRKHALGIVTTHYLNLKIMANKTPGIHNGAMAFDEKNLEPLYKLMVGQPGSSYTFAIAERIGLDHRLINRARKLVDEGHVRLDKLLNQAEQDRNTIARKEKELTGMIRENQKLKKEMEDVMNREKHRQQVELLRQKNKVTEERLAYLKEMERKLKQIVIDWKKTEDKQELIRHLKALLFRQKEKQQTEKLQKKFDKKWILVSGNVEPGNKVLMKKSHQVGIVREIRGRKAVVQVGLMPITIDLQDLSLVQDKVQDPQPE